MAKQSKQHPPIAPLFQPKPLRWEDVNWRAISNRPGFQMIGLCNRHVQIDQTGRDWYGMPYIVDEVAAPLQGIPYVKPFRTQDEVELNEHLWQLHFLSQGPHALAIEKAYSKYVQKQTAQPGARIHTIEAFFQRMVFLKVTVGILPKPRIAKFYIKHWTDEDYRVADKWEEEHPHQRKASPTELFAQLDYVGRVIFALEGLIESCRQRIIFAQLEREHETEQLTNMGMKTAISQAHWAKVDQQRDKQFKERVAARRQNPEITFTTAVEQLDMFKNATHSPSPEQVSA